MLALLIRCYPARWRDRYGDEFAAVLEERTLGPFDVADILIGAIAAHLRLRGLWAASDRKGLTMSLRLGGYAAIVGGLLWLFVLAGSVINDGEDPGAQVLGFAAVAAIVMTLVALVGLSSFQARRHPVLIWAAFAIPAVGAVVGLLGWAAMFVIGDSDAELIGGLSAWAISSLGLLMLLVGSGLFALATWRARSLSRGAAALLGVGALLVVPALGGLNTGLGPPLLGEVVLVAMIVALPAGWMGLGFSALRIARPIRGQLGGSPS
jgi:hypothetical protein